MASNDNNNYIFFYDMSQFIAVALTYIKALRK